MLIPPFQVHDWVTGFGVYPLASEEENCLHLIEVSDFEVQESIRHVPKLDTLILVKSMIKNHSFGNPFSALVADKGSQGRRERRQF
jgi:[calcium/calmodulin-dependent protein kinase] kinase